MSRSIAWFAFAVLMIISFPAFASYHRVLSTPTRIVTIVVRCPEGDAECSDVVYVEIDKTSGLVVQLTGTDWVRRCPVDGAPCQHLGFKFPSRQEIYYVSDDGVITHISSDGKASVKDQGRWLDD
jgi:hypothetical protein